MSTISVERWDGNAPFSLLSFSVEDVGIGGGKPGITETVATQLQIESWSCGLPMALAMRRGR